MTPRAHPTPTLGSRARRTRDGPRCTSSSATAPRTASIASSSDRDPPFERTSGTWGPGCVQHFADLARQLVGGERLLQEGDARIEHTVMDHRVLGGAGLIQK